MLTGDRNPFNDSLIASGSDDGKVPCHFEIDSLDAHVYRSSYGEFPMTSLSTWIFLPTRLKTFPQLAS